MTVDIESRSGEVNLMLGSSSFGSLKMLLALHRLATVSQKMRCCMTEPANEAFGRDAQPIQTNSPASLRNALISVCVKNRS